MELIEPIKLNNLYNNKLTHNKCQQLYSIYLEKDKYYFIDLVSKDDYEFNLRIYDSKKNKININSNIDDSSYKYKLFDILKEDNFIFYKSNNTNDNKEEEYEEDEEDYEEDYEKEKSYKYKEDKKKVIEDSFFDDDMDDDMDENQKYEIGEKTMKLVIYENPDDPNDKIELIIDFITPEEDTSKYHNNITKITNNKKIIDYNNKIYYSPYETDEYIISVTSDYKGEEGEYSFIIKEVEDVSISLEKKLILNEDTIIKFKKKLVSQKFVINLDRNKTYNLLSKNHGLKIFIFGEGMIYSNENNLDITFTTILGDKYLIDIIPINNNHTNIITLTEKGHSLDNPITHNIIRSPLVNLSEQGTKLTNLYTESIIMKDKLNDDEFSLHIENGKLIIEKI